MALPTTKKLIEAAKKGETLSPKDRRQCIGVLMATQPELTNDEMAEMFKVSERMIRFDKKPFGKNLPRS
jgi:predicted HTH transcriptional regulator